MKYSILILSITSYVFILIAYYSKRSEIKTTLNSYFPKRYNTKNPAETTVFYQANNIKSTVIDDIIPLSNSEFSYKPKKFEIDDTNLLTEESLICSPDSFGYSIERGKEVFKDKIYPNCSKVNKQNETFIHIDRDSNKLYMNCPGNNNKVLYGPFDGRKFIIGEEAFNKWQIHDYTGPIAANKIEFALGSCDNDNELLAQGNTVPIFNKNAYIEAKEKVKDKPKLIFFLTVDSFSRRHFFRKLPDTLEFLNKLNEDPESEFDVFDFKLQNVLGGDSPSNQVPIFSGEAKFKRGYSGNQNTDFLGEKAIWNKLREKGFVSLLGFEDCDSNFVKGLGRKPNVDYAVGPFYCAIKQFVSESFGTGVNLQRCLSGHQTHYYILNYTKSVIEMNKGVNIMAYLHLNAAHEGTGLHGGTLNYDLKEFLSTFLSKYKSDFDMLIFINGDHGMRYGSWHTDLSAFQEQKLPALFLLASKSLLSKFPYAYHSLSNNTLRLVSKLDYRKTALFVAGIEEDTPNAINFFNEIAPKSRTCNDLETDPSYCSCLQMTQVNVISYEDFSFFEKLKDYAENAINSMGYSEKQHFIGRICKKIKLNSISNVYHIGINNFEEIFRIEFVSFTRKGMKFAVNFFISSNESNMNANKKKFRVENLVLRGTPVKARIWSIVRLDQYGGNCELEARKYGIKAEYCACKDIDD